MSAFTRGIDHSGASRSSPRDPGRKQAEAALQNIRSRVSGQRKYSAAPQDRHPHATGSTGPRWRRMLPRQPTRSTRCPTFGSPTMTNTANQKRELIVIGGGQAGLAIGYLLARQGRDFTILEAAGEPAAIWGGRWDSLKLFTSARYDSLPGLEFPGDPDRYPTRDEVASYLADYAKRFDLPLELNSRVRSIRRAGER